MKNFLTIFFIAALLMNANAQTERLMQLPAIGAAKTKFPLFLDKLNEKNVEIGLETDTAVKSKTEAIILSYYFNECAGDSNETNFGLVHVYPGTFVLRDSFITTYLVLLKHKPGDELNGKVFFYDNKTKSVIDTVIDFNIYALYDLKKGKPVPSNLKKELKINTPEIELVDYDKDGINDFKFTRLYHNGTANAIETFILKVSNNKVERLSFERSWIK
ncbi:MAG: hypothetical protein QM757_11510 [Paludibaculum sp.]